MKSRILRLFDLISNIKWDIIFYKKILLDKEFRRSMKSNKKFRDLHLGKRCFIVGNGNSLKKLDLTKITNEIVFTVNNIMANKDLYKTLSSDYHVLIDPDYLRLDPNKYPEDNDRINLLKQINNENKKPVCIVRDDAKNAFENYGINKELDIHYIYQHRNFSDTYTSKIDMCKNMPSPQNVIQAAIFSAMYMGFKKIYLIGVDMTAVFMTYEADDNGETVVRENSHAYNFTNKDIHTMLSRFRYDNEFMMNDYAKTFTIFKRIRKYAERKNIEIINATKGGGLDVFKRVRYESLF